MTKRTQTATRQVSIRGIIASAAFRQGYEDAAKDRPWRDLDDMKGNKRTSQTNMMWHYERGRYFAKYLRAEGDPIMSLKDHRGRVRFAVMDRFSDALKQRAII